MTESLARWRRRLHAFEDLLLATLLLALLALAVLQIALRIVADAGLAWSEPVSRLMVLWLAVLGALAATRERKHVAIDIVPRLLPAPWRRAAWIVAQGAAAAASAVLAWLCADLVALELEAPAQLPGGLPVWAGMLVLPVAFAAMALRFALSTFAPPPRQPPMQIAGQPSTPVPSPRPDPAPPP